MLQSAGEECYYSVVARRLVSRFVPFVFVVVVFPCEQAAALTVKMTTEELAKAAEIIVFATVEKVVQPDPDRYRLEVRLSLSEKVKGKIEGDLLCFSVTGGVVNGVGVISSEIPTFTPGESVILFLQAGKYPRFPVVAGKQGCLRVEKGMIVEKGIKAGAYLEYVRSKLAVEAGRGREEAREEME